MVDVKILYFQYTNPGAYPPVEHSSRIMAERGWKVTVLGVHSLTTERLRFATHPNVERRLLGYCAPGWRQKLHYGWFALWVIVQALRWRPGWIYASDELSCPVAVILSYCPSLRVIYHEHDCPGEAWQSGKRTRFMRFVLRCRRKLARRSVFCILPNQERVEEFKRQTGTKRPILCVWNCPSLSEVPGSSIGAKSHDKFILFYHGSIVPARVPLTVLHAICMMPASVRFQVAGYETIGHPGYVAQLEAEACRLGIGERFEYLGAFPRADLFALCRKANVGLSLMPNSSGDLNERYMTGASNKPFDYLACGLPLIVSDVAEWEVTFVIPGYALACDPQNPKSIGSAIRWFMEHPDLTRKMGEAGCQRILKDWNYETQFAPAVQKILEQ